MVFNNNRYTPGFKIIKIIHCNRGSTQLFLSLALFILMGLILATASNILKNYRETRLIIDSMICMRKSIFYQSEMISKINTYNKVILVNFPLKISPTLYIAQTAKALTIAMKTKQQYEIFSYLRKIYRIKECSTICKLKLVKDHPYTLNTGFILKRTLFGTTKIKKTKFSSTYFKHFKYMYTSQVMIKGNFDNRPSFELSENLWSKVSF